MVDGAYRWQGTALAPDAARIAEIDAAWTDDGVDAFAEPVRSAAVDRLERALAAVRAGDLTGAVARLTEARAMLDALDPAALEPRRGLAGLFDSRNARLKRFRAAWSRAAAGLSGIAADLSERIEGTGRRSGALDGVWTEIRDALADLDAHLAAAAARLKGHTATEGDPPHPLAARRATLDACRAGALQSLPLIRGAQNADARAAEAMKACADGVVAWRDEWKDLLGLTHKRPKKVRPDQARLARVRDDLRALVDRAVVELKASSARHAEAEARLAALRRGP